MHGFIRAEEELKILGSTNDEIFLAKPIMVDEDDELQPTITTLQYDEAEVEEDSSSPNSSANPPASLSFSEDSDTTRIYEIQTMETRFEKTPKAAPTPLSPETVKFLTPKPKFTKPVQVAETRDKEVRRDLFGHGIK